MNKLVLDTSFLIDIFRFGIDTAELDDYELCTVKGVVKELKELAKHKASEGKYARIALKWLEARQVSILTTGKARTDDMIVDVAADCVGTDDRELRKRLKAMGVKTIYVRARKHLETG